MRRDQLEHAIRTACQIINHQEIIIVGSQSILGTFRESELPPEATMSREIDALPIAATNEETSFLADLIEGVAGEMSPFEETHGFSIDGVDLSTCVLPEGWQERLVKVSNVNTTGPSGTPQFTGWCLDKEDLCVAKAVAGRDKDRRFVAALLDSQLVDSRIISERLKTVPKPYEETAVRAGEWLVNISTNNQGLYSKRQKKLLPGSVTPGGLGAGKSTHGLELR